MLLEGCIALLTLFFFFVFYHKRNGQQTRADQSTEDFSLVQGNSMCLLEKLESPQVLTASNKLTDNILFNGTSSDGGFLVLSICRYLERHSEVMLTLNIPSIGMLQTSRFPFTDVFNTSADSFSAGGLKFVCVEPGRTWRIAFSGLLRKFPNGVARIDDNFEPIHVKFSLMYNAVTRIYLFDDVNKGTFSASASSIQCPKTSCYEQGGEMRGIICVENEPEFKVLYKSFRQHAFRQPVINSCRNIAIYAWLEDGTFASVTVNTAEADNKSKCGWVSYPNSELHPVSSVMLDVSDFETRFGLPEKFTCSFSAGFRNYHVTVTVTPWLPLSYYRQNCDTIKAFCILESNGVKGRGVTYMSYESLEGAIISSPFTHERSVQAVPTGLEAGDDIKSPHLALTFTDFRCANAALVGGKGAQLAQLTQLQLPDFVVPKGFCIGIDAFDLHLRNRPDILDKIYQLQNLIGTGPTDSTLEEACSALVSALLVAPISEELVQLIHDQLELTFGESWHHRQLSFAARSSAAGEDGDELSGAGQMDTILGVRDLPSLLQAVQKCWASNFALPATQYRRQHGQVAYQCRLDKNNDEGAGGGIAVVIQEMVPADAAGVLFTRDPVTGNPGLMSLSANFGLGESVVSGVADPDNIVIARSCFDEVIGIKSKEVGGKKVAILLEQDGGGTTESSLSEEQSKSCCVSDDVILRLAKIGIQLEKHYSDARDIEWAVKGRQIYILQARPITTLDGLSEWELMHELDTPLAGTDELMTTGNVGEMMPGALTPLTSSLFSRAVDYALAVYYVKSGVASSYCPYLSKYIGTATNQLFINIHMVHALSEFRAVMASYKMGQLALLGEVREEVTEQKLVAYHGKERFWTRLRNFYMNYKVMQQCQKKVELLDKRLDSLVIGQDCTTAKQLYQAIDDHIPLYYEGWADTVCNSSKSAVWGHVLMSVITKGQLEWNLEHYSDMAILLSKCEDVYSADVPSALQILAQKIIETGQSEHFSSLTPEEAVLWLRSSESGAAGDQFSVFMKRHGHRCVREAEFREISWRLQPSRLTAVLQSLVRSSGKKFSISQKVEDVAEAISKIKTPLTVTARFALKSIVPKARRAVGSREWGKSVSIKMEDVFKQAYWRLAELMVKEGRLPDADLLMFLQHREVAQLLRTRSAALITRAQKRRKILDKQMQVQYERINFGHPVPISSLNGEPNEELVTSSKVTGLPVSQGTVKGTARVVRSLQDASQIQPGDILIVHFTDVGWTPYFPLIGGLVTEIGGLISHGAVVAREYGLPCIVKCQSATRIFKSGDTVILNATLGTVEKVEVVMAQ